MNNTSSPRVQPPTHQKLQNDFQLVYCWVTTRQLHNIIQIHNNVPVELTISYKIFPTFNVNDGLFCKILSVPHNIVMNLNNVVSIPFSNLICITLFKSIKMLCGTYNTPHKILRYFPHLAWMWGIFYEYCQSHRSLLWIWIMLCKWW